MVDDQLKADPWFSRTFSHDVRNREIPVSRGSNPCAPTFFLALAIGVQLNAWSLSTIYARLRTAGFGHSTPGVRKMFDMAGDDVISFGLGEPDFQPA